MITTGDLDYVINNINEEVTLYENTLNNAEKINSNYLQLQLKGNDKNLNGIGAMTEIYYDSSRYAGIRKFPLPWLFVYSRFQTIFGLGKTTIIDSVVIRWPNHKKQVLTKVAANQVLKADIINATIDDNWSLPAVASNTYFTDITKAAGIDFEHQEMDYIDFNAERLLPHKLSQYGPGLAVADIDKNGLDDIFLGGNSDFTGQVFFFSNLMANS